MRCARCGHPSAGASWYCGNCGAPLEDLNVADSVHRRPLPAVVRWSLALSATALVAVAVVAAGATAWRAFRPFVSGPDDSAAATTPRPTRPDAVTTESEASSSPATAAPATPAGAAGGRTGDPTATVPAPTTGPDVPTPFVRPNVPVWRIPRLAEAPEVDGELDEWAGTPIDVVAVVFGAEHWTGPDDLSARAFGGWDDVALYLGVQVTDDVFSQPASGTRLYLGDSLELQLDTDLAGDADGATYSADDWQIGVSPGDFIDREPEAYAWRPPQADLSGLRLRSQRLDNGYIVEAALPWSAIVFSPDHARSLGVAVNVSDNDDPRPAQLSMISLSPARSWSDPRTFAVLVLED